MTDPAALLAIDAALRGALIALCTVLGLALWRQRRSLQRSGRHGEVGASAPEAPTAPPALTAAALLCLGLIVQAVGSQPWVEQQARCSWQVPLIGVAVGNAVLFWLFAATLFDDAFRWRRRHALAWATAAAIGAVQCPAVLNLPPGPLLGALRLALRLVPLVCAAATLWVLLRQGRNDLVESRRRLRVVLVLAGIGYSLLHLAARRQTPLGLLGPDLALLDIAGQVALVGGWALLMLRLPERHLLLPERRPAPAATWPATAGPMPELERPTAAPSAPPDPPEPPAVPDASENSEATDPAELRLSEALQRAMAQDRLHRLDDLTVAGLARQLGVPEYRLRRHIHQRLGFRNFSAFVNSHRLADARRWLADPALRDTPVLTLALDAGFGSIGPFNRAFKADTGLTPTEFRARALAHSQADS